MTKITKKFRAVSIPRAKEKTGKKGERLGELAILGNLETMQLQYLFHYPIISYLILPPFRKPIVLIYYPRYSRAKANACVSCDSTYESRNNFNVINSTGSMCRADFWLQPNVSLPIAMTWQLKTLQRRQPHLVNCQSTHGR